MFQFITFPSICYFTYILITNHFLLVEFPHSDIHGLMDICSYPWLFAAYHVLLRLLVPRHSPYALSSLTFKILKTSSCFVNLHLKISSMYKRTPLEFLVRLPRNTRFWVFCASKLYFSFSHFRLLFSTVCILRFLFCFSTLLPLNCFLVLLVYLFWYLIYLYIFQCAMVGSNGIVKPRPKNNPPDYFCLTHVRHVLFDSFLLLNIF